MRQSTNELNTMSPSEMLELQLVQPSDQTRASVRCLDVVANCRCEREEVEYLNNTVAVLDADSALLHTTVSIADCHSKGMPARSSTRTA